MERIAWVFDGPMMVTMVLMAWGHYGGMMMMYTYPLRAFAISCIHSNGL